MTGPVAAAGPAPSQVAGWLRRLGPLAAHRPAPSLARSVAGGGGALVAGGVIAVAGDRWASTGSTGVAVVLTAGLLGAGLIALVRGTGAVRVAAVSASGLAAPAVAFFLNAGGGFPSVRGTAVLAAALLGGLYVVGPAPGHTFHLAILVIAGWLLALSLADVGGGAASFGGFRTLGEVLTDAGVASMAIGALYLGAGWWLDRQGLEGLATPFLAVGALALPLGTLTVVRDGGDLVGGTAAVAVGAGIALVGGGCGRRGTTWAGVAVGAAGLLPVARAIAPDGVVVAALLVAAAGAGLVALAPLAGRTAGEPAGAGDEDQPVPNRTTASDAGAVVRNGAEPAVEDEAPESPMRATAPGAGGVARDGADPLEASAPEGPASPPVVRRRRRPPGGTA